MRTSPDWQSWLDRWTSAGLLDAEASMRIAAFEREAAPARGRLRWPVALALTFGGILIGAGLLLFVSAHWERLSPGERLTLIIVLFAGIHTAGACSSPRFPALGTTLHAVGTVALGGVIGMLGQIFHIEEHWPNAMLLWALGAWAGVALLRDWAQAGAAALLTPAWLASELSERAPGQDQALVAGLLAIAFLYLGVARPGRNTGWRRCLTAIGSLAVLVLALTVPLTNQKPPLNWSLALGLGLGAAILGWFWRPDLPGGRSISLAVAWTAVYVGAAQARLELAVYGWAAVGAVGLVAWGWQDGRTERINLGIAAFAITVLLFYFSSVMSALDRSLSLILLGGLFLGGGWQLERLRRQLIGSVQQREAAQ